MFVQICANVMNIDVFPLGCKYKSFKMFLCWIVKSHWYLWT